MKAAHPKWTYMYMTERRGAGATLRIMWAGSQTDGHARTQ